MKLGAIGWAVNVADAQGLRRLRDAAGGLAVLPIHGDDLAGRIPLKHYPVLITATSVEQ
jgi:integrating conjugative element protein (TIGR03765 family)